MNNDNVVELTALDLCDGCGARAYSMAQREGMPDLLFCIHHMKESWDRLKADGWEITHDTDGLSLLADNEKLIYA